jgi:hypothetical protein
MPTCWFVAYIVNRDLLIAKSRSSRGMRLDYRAPVYMRQRLQVSDLPSYTYGLLCCFRAMITRRGEIFCIAGTIW